MGVIGSLISIFPCLIPLGAILSASLHTIWHFVYAHRSGTSEKVGFVSDVQMATRIP
ncbi:hypothetical protein F5Y01DRAFT_293319 [Xylaria sp. FL0043]|nr:hypothetical protein F5Y01DRAFT_293319 [Xylaria sp. FL0043]